MKIVSFAWTSPALVAGRKTVTRRDWNDDYARRFKAGDLVAAYNRQPRHRGEQIATIRIVSVAKEPLSTMPDSDYEGEGFAFLAANPHLLPKSGDFSDPWMVSRERFAQSQRASACMWVVRFELVEVVG